MIRQEFTGLPIGLESVGVIEPFNSYCLSATVILDFHHRTAINSLRPPSTLAMSFSIAGKDVATKS